MVRVGPEFGRQEDVFARDATFANSGADLEFGVISARVSKVEVRQRGAAYTLAVSMWRYPSLRALATASSCCSGSWKVPKPILGILAPVLSVKDFVVATGELLENDL